MEPRQIHLKDGKKEYFICMDDILFVKADGNYSDLYLITKTAYNTVRIQIGQLWKLIEEVKPANSHTLARIGRSYIINLKYLQYANPKKKLITLCTDKAVELKDMPCEAVKSLLMLLSKEKRREVLRTEFIEERVLAVPVEELNEEHLKSNGFEYVDLGLPSGTLWAARNLSQGILPVYLAWGELHQSKRYDWQEYKYSDDTGMKFTTNLVSPKTHVLLPEYDVARKVGGGGWRMPTAEEFEELSRECIFVWCKATERIQGLLATGPNGNRIFLPANGIAEDSEIKDYGEACCYWTATGYGRRLAHAMQFRKGIEPTDGLFFGESQACCGRSIRPVISKEDVCKDE